MAPIVYLISGANRGIGFALAKALLTNPEVVVFAGARQPHAATALHELEKTHQGRVHVVKLTSADEDDNRAAVAEIRKTVGRLDVVIANAGIARFHGKALDTPLEVMREHVEVNALGVLALFKASYPLLKESTPTPKFVAISSGAGSVTFGPTVPMHNLPYFTSKASENMIVRKIRAENDGLVCFPIAPGPTATDMTKGAVERHKDSNLPPELLVFKDVDQTAVQILARIDEATRETDALVQHDGTTLPW